MTRTRTAKAEASRVTIAGVVIVALFAVAAVLAAIALAGCSNPGPDRTACKAAMRQQYATALATGKSAGGEPAPCKGLPASVLAQFAGEIAGSQFPSPEPVFTDPNGSVCPSPAPGDPGFGSGVCPPA